MTAPDRRRFKIVSWNLLHTVGARLDDVAGLIEAERPDLLVMQEATAAIGYLPSRVGGYYACALLPGRLHGVATWSALPFLQPPAALALQRGLIIRRVCQVVQLAELSLVNVHLSHGQWLNRRQLRHIAAALPPHAMIIGDCNLVGPAHVPGFRDIGPRMSTHAAGRLIPFRLDRCFVRGLDIAAVRLLAKGSSDHCPMVIELAL